MSSAWTVRFEDIEQAFDDMVEDAEILAAVRGLDNQYQDEIATLEAALAEAREVMAAYADNWNHPEGRNGARARAWLEKYGEGW